MTKGRDLEASDIIVNHRERRGAEYVWLLGNLAYHCSMNYMKTTHPHTHATYPNLLLSGKPWVLNVGMLSIVVNPGVTCDTRFPE